MDRSNPPLTWRKSRFSGTGENCVEVANLPEGSMAVRDSKIPSGPMLRFSRSAWKAFIVGARDGGLD